MKVGRRTVLMNEVSVMTKMTVLLGTNGTGKTTALRNILVASGRRALVVTPDDREWTDYEHTELREPQDFVFQGVRRHIFDPERTLRMIKYFQNGILVFDDCRGYLRSNTSDEIRQLLIRRRQRCVDIFAVGHGFTEVPPVFFTFATDFILFQTRDNMERRKHYVRDFEALRRKVEEVNGIALGRVAHPRDYGVPGLAGRKVADIHYCDVIANE